MKYYILLLLFISNNFLQAQSNDLGGVWVLQQKVHVAGPEYINALPNQFTFSNTKDSLVVEFVSVGADGKESKSRVSTAHDGKETIIRTNANRKVTRKLELAKEQNGFSIITVFYMPDSENEVDFTRVETLKIVDGRLHVNKKSIETRSETWEVNGVYTKK